MSTSFHQTELSTDHSLLTLAVSPGACAEALNLIIAGNDGQTSTAMDFSFAPKLAKTARRMNAELERRNISYRISSCFCSSAALLLYLLIIPAFIQMSQIAQALNLLAEDYNKRG